ncbi:amidase, partial [Candidatus Kaiserbacteria bacterium]|nr:amidase [Candidatus Kaiserbacteria bacterium]
DAGRQTKQAGRPWRIGFVKTHTWELAPQYAKDAMVAFVEKLGKDSDFHVVEATLPERSTRAHVIHETIYNKALSYYFKDEYKQSDFVSKVMQDMIANGHQIQRDEYARALGEQMEFIYDMDEWFADYDILISLSTAGEAPLRDVTETPDPALMWTLAHLPVVSVPQFRSPTGLPFGFQAAARKYNDLLLFNFLDELRVRDVIPVRGGLEMTTV